MRFIIVAFIILCASSCYSQTFETNPTNKLDTINMIDAMGKKQGKWALYGKHKQNQCYAPTQIAETGNYLDNRKKGEWIEYFCNGNTKNKITFVNGRQDGYAILYYENGKLKEEGNWKNNRWVGAYKLYYDNGQVQHNFTFSNTGHREGIATYMHPNGKLALQGVFKDGKESGVFKEWNEEGKLKAEKSYADGQVDMASIKIYETPTAEKIEALPNAPKAIVKADEKEVLASNVPKFLNGQHTLYNGNKQIAKSGVFKDNRLMEGKSYEYDENGILKRITVYKNGIYVGDAPVEN